ncbi:MAG: inositol-phosphate phosphatase [Gammaproteobacteria bacterium]|nr:inositol-phosphate phosphatase [Gammaproteobacteria bacterium]
MKASDTVANPTVEFLNTALEAIVAAEHVLMGYFNNTVDIAIKLDNSPVTQADIEANKVILDIISRQWPEHAILSEEGGIANSKSDYLWVVDPLDGTKNYIRGIPLFGTQIALLRASEIILGASKLPALGELLYSAKNLGAFLDENRVRVSTIDSLSKSYINLGGLNHFAGGGRSQNVLQLANSAARVRSVGDSYGYHLVATGRCEAVIESKVQMWDIAPFIQIVQEAGGTCTDIDGRPLTLESTTIVCSNGKIHQAVLNILTG